MALRQNPGTRLIRAVAAMPAMLALVAVVGGGVGAQQASAGEAAAGQGLRAQIEAALDRSPGGRQISANQIAWENGTVVLTFPRPGERAARGADEPVTAKGTANCPYTWTCLYEKESWEGRRLMFTECGYIQDLGDYDFNDKATSWHNNQTKGIRTTVYDWDGNNWDELWTESRAPSLSSHVSRADDDRADGILAC